MLSSTGFVPCGTGTHPFSYSHPSTSSVTSSTSFRCRSQSSHRMATPPTSSVSSTISADNLSAELISLICTHLRDIDYSSLFALRLASRRFSAITTPVIFQTLDLNEPLVNSDIEERYPQILQYIRSYTQHVVIRGDLDPVGIRRILSTAKKLKSIRWKYEEGHIRFANLWLPSDVLDSEQIQSNGVKLHVEGLPLRDFEGDIPDAYLRAVPASCLSSLQLAIPIPPLTTKLHSLKRLLLQAPNLTTFHYRDRGQGTNFQFYPNERMPAFSDLVLESYDWNHSQEDVKAHWDFSNIRSLRLISVPVFNFLSSVPLSALSDIHTLQVDDYSAHLPDRREDATQGLYTLIKDNIKALEDLELTCHMDLFPLDAISQHADSLRSLRLRDHIGFGDEHRRCPTLSPTDLARLASRLVHIHTLELDMDLERCDPSRFLPALSAFRNMQTLTLHVQTVLSPFDPIVSDDDEDYEATMKIFRFLAELREHTNPDLPWKRITVNVGGWRRVMVRRVSTTWRERNERGIFAERCFVLERNEGGRYNVWEETGYESPMMVRSPEP